MYHLHYYRYPCFIHHPFHSSKSNDGGRVELLVMAKLRRIIVSNCRLHSASGASVGWLFAPVSVDSRQCNDILSDRSKQLLKKKKSSLTQNRQLGILGSYKAGKQSSLRLHDYMHTIRGLLRIMTELKISRLKKKKKGILLTVWDLVAVTPQILSRSTIWATVATRYCNTASFLGQPKYKYLFLANKNIRVVRFQRLHPTYVILLWKNKKPNR